MKICCETTDFRILAFTPIKLLLSHIALEPNYYIDLKTIIHIANLWYVKTKRRQCVQQLSAKKDVTRSDQLSAPEIICTIMKITNNKE